MRHDYYIVTCTGIADGQGNILIKQNTVRSLVKQYRAALINCADRVTSMSIERSLRELRKYNPDFPPPRHVLGSP